VQNVVPILRIVSLQNNSAPAYALDAIRRANYEIRITMMGWTAPRPASMCQDGRCTDDLVTFYHGTDPASAANIAQNGFNLSAARELGGGDQVWTTRNLTDAVIYF
jgi:hypothetical protein